MLDENLLEDATVSSATDHLRANDVNLLAFVERSHLVEEEQAEQLGIQPLAGRAVDHRRLGQGYQPEGGMDSQDTVLAHLLVGSAVLFLYLVVTIGPYEPLTVVQLELPIVN